MPKLLSIYVYSERDEYSESTHDQILNWNMNERIKSYIL